MELNIKNENIRKFLEKFEEDQELQAKLQQIRDPEEAYKLASSVQEGFTKEEFVTEMTRLYEEITKDLSEEDLEKIAGGATALDVIESVVSGAGIIFFGAVASL